MEEGEREEKRRGWTNLLTLELIEQNESCTETKRDRKAKGREGNLMKGEEEGGYAEVRQTQEDEEEEEEA